VISAQRLLPLGAALMLGACASGPPPGPAVIVVPGSGKDFTAFQQDDTICQRHAVANTGYGDLARAHTQGSANTAPIGATGEIGMPRAAGTTGGVATAVGAPSGSDTPAATSRASTPEPPDETIPNQLQFVQCMAARGDTVRPAPSGYTEAANWYGYAYPYDYPYGFYDGGFIGVFRRRLSRPGLSSGVLSSRRL